MRASRPEPGSVFPMALVVLIIGGALVAGLAAGGSLRNLERVRVHWWGLAIVALLLQAGLPGGWWRAAALVVSYTLLLAFVAVNRWVPGAAVAAVGLLANLAVVGANGGMPVGTWAVEVGGGSTAVMRDEGKHVPMDDSTVLAPLGDTIPVPPPVGAVLSIGDVLLYGGLAWFLVAAGRDRAGPNPRPLEPWVIDYRGKHAPSHWRLPARDRVGVAVSPTRPGPLDPGRAARAGPSASDPSATPHQGARAASARSPR